MTGSAHPDLGRAVAACLHIDVPHVDIDAFPDGELHVQVDEHVHDAHVYLLQPTGPPVARHVLELMLLADACRRAGARHITAVIPYFGYARQDRRTQPGEAVGVRVIADMLTTVRLDGIVVVDPHVPTLEAISATSLTALTAVPTLAGALKHGLPRGSVLVAPDLGAVKLAERYASILDLPVAVVHKTRLSGTEVRARRVIGDVSERTPVIVDDMISTGATIAAAIRAVTAAGSRHDVLVAATHGLFCGAAADTLSDLGIRRLVVTDTLAPPEKQPPRIEVVSVASMLADAIEAHGHRLLGLRTTAHHGSPGLLKHR
ncbi:MAG TPA: ribose-phosphate pyrophosphokinase [Euzebyales bacterium]|nr:ribose-phosphate pyrophosphokinase [Euzebyales bacterium]